MPFSSSAALMNAEPSAEMPMAEESGWPSPMYVQAPFSYIQRWPPKLPAMREPSKVVLASIQVPATGVSSISKVTTSSAWTLPAAANARSPSVINSLFMRDLPAIGVFVSRPGRLTARIGCDATMMHDDQGPPLTPTCQRCAPTLQEVDTPRLALAKTRFRTCYVYACGF